MSSLLRLMRYNDWENDPEAVVPFCHPGEGRTPAGSIANRLDLAPDGHRCDWGDELDWMIGKKWG